MNNMNKEKLEIFSDGLKKLYPFSKLYVVEGTVLKTCIVRSYNMESWISGSHEVDIAMLLNEWVQDEVIELIGTAMVGNNYKFWIKSNRGNNMSAFINEEDAKHSVMLESKRKLKEEITDLENVLAIKRTELDLLEL